MKQIKKYFMLLVIVTGLIPSCSSLSIPDADAWIYKQKGEPGIDLTGIWYSKQLGLSELKTIGDYITGYVGKYAIKGSVNKNNVSLVFISDNFKKVKFVVRLNYKKNRMEGYYSTQFAIPKKDSKKIRIVFIKKDRQFKETFKKKNPKAIYAEFIGSRLNTIELANEWLKFKEGKTKINITGSYSEPDWGKIELYQINNKIVGKCGSYRIKGVINSKKIYLLFLSYHYYVSYACVLNFEKDKLTGMYSSYIHYDDSYKDAYYWPFNAVKK